MKLKHSETFWGAEFPYAYEWLFRNDNGSSLNNGENVNTTTTFV